MPTPPHPEDPTPRSRWNRRRFLRTVFGGCAVAAGYATLIEPHWTEWTCRALPIRDLPPALEGATLVHLSDLHASPMVAEDYLAGVFRRTHQLRPDFVVVTGDWLSWHGTPQLERLRRALLAFPRGTRGTLGILGNHDWGREWRNARFAAEVAGAAAAAGVRILRNEVVQIDGLTFAGLDDIWSPGFEAEPLLAASPLPASTIALCHNPDGADLPIWPGHRGWILSGHTHGGQCKPPFLPPPMLPVKNRRYTHGAFQLAGDRQLYISRGVGNLMHVRFNARPEVVLFTLRRAA